MTPYYEEKGITIYHGDCREILPTLEKVDLLLTDPPYGINYKHGIAKGPNASKFDGKTIHGDDKPFDPLFLLHFEKLILWGANNYSSRLPQSGGWFVWDKRCGSVVNDMSDCELAWTNLMNTARMFYHVWDGFRRGSQTGVDRLHPTEKPISLMKWCILQAKKADTILDPFMGSGTTLRAAKDLGRKAVGIEIEERYCEIAVKRLSQEVFAL
jgi:site-specific DNA-methyltransferase (adenine-specific)